MEIGHNVMHGQWDWMNDPEIHSSNWEWDTTQPAEQWKHSHNYVHHQFTNVLGHDNDVGYGVLRMTREQKWHPVNLGQPIYNALLALFFEWGVALHDLDIEAIRKGEKDPKELKRQLKQIGKKVRTPVAKDYVIFPLLTGPFVLLDADGQRHGQPDAQPLVVHDHLLRPLPRRGDALHRGGARGRDARRVVPAPDARLGQLRGRPAAAHHVRQPRLPDRAPPVPRPAEQPLRGDLGQGARDLRERYDIPYTTGPLHKQYGQVLRTITKLALPNGLTTDDSPDPAEPDRPRRRLTDAERPTRRLETGTWSKRRSA